MKHLTKLSELSECVNADCYGNGVYFKNPSQSLERISSIHHCGISEQMYDNICSPFGFLATNVYMYQHIDRMSTFTIRDYCDDVYSISKTTYMRVPISKLKIIDAIRRI